MNTTLLAQVEADLKLVKHWHIIQLHNAPLPHLRGQSILRVSTHRGAGVPLEDRAEEVVVAVRASESVSPARFSHLLTSLRVRAFTLAVVDADSTVSYYKVRKESIIATHLRTRYTIHSSHLSSVLPLSESIKYPSRKPPANEPCNMAQIGAACAALVQWGDALADAFVRPGGLYLHSLHEISRIHAAGGYCGITLLAKRNGSADVVVHRPPAFIFALPGQKKTRSHWPCSVLSAFPRCDENAMSIA